MESIKSMIVRRDNEILGNASPHLLSGRREKIERERLEFRRNSVASFPILKFK